jgi:hypothetical protein
VRPGRDPVAALWSAEAILASGAFAVVVLDIPPPAAARGAVGAASAIASRSPHGRPFIATI